MLEVGGEIQVRGMSPRGDAWRLAVERPTPGSRGQVFTAIEVKDIGVATSGDYRNFFEDEGRRFSHLIDPRTGYPIEHDLVSATVVHPSTMIADAWATALMVVGTEEALRLADVYELAVFLISREDDQLVSSYNDAMTQWLMEPEVGERQSDLRTNIFSVRAHCRRHVCWRDGRSGAYKGVLRRYWSTGH